MLVISKAPAARSEHPLAGPSLIPWVALVYVQEDGASNTSRLLSTIRILVTNYFSPACLGSVNCFAMLVPTVAVSTQNRRFTSDFPFGYSVGRVLLVPFLGCDSPDLGTRFFARLTL
jgi:hypothetical protein